LEYGLHVAAEIGAQSALFWYANRLQTRMDGRFILRSVTPGVAGSSPVHFANQINVSQPQCRDPFVFGASRVLDNGDA